MNNSYDTSAEFFVDPHEEVFTGPISEREREIRKKLPRKTLHPSEVVELTERGMSYREWEEYKEQCNGEAIHHVYGEDHESSLDSFSSCNFNDEAEVNDGSLNDTWEIQERMLAMAERLERGEDIPELGIHHNAQKDDSVDMDGIFPLEETKNSEASKTEAEVRVEQKDGTDEILASQAILSASTQVCCTTEVNEIDTVHSSAQSLYDLGVDKSTVVEVVALKTDQNLIDLHSIVVEEAGQNGKTTPNELLVSFPPNASVTDVLLMKTPARTPKSTLSSSSPALNEPKVFKTPSRTPLSASTKKTTPLSRSVLKKPTPSPVGMYIRGGPEPVLIENVRPTHKKLLFSNPNVTRQKVAVKNAQGRWSIDVRRNLTSSSSAARNSKENEPEMDSNIKPVLPVVLHEAAASFVTENGNNESPTMPWSRGKIGKLLERNPSPTVLKHQGRIKINKSDITQSTKIPNLSVTLKSGVNPNRRDSSLMDVSLLQEVVNSIQHPAPQKSAIPVRCLNTIGK